MKSTIQSGIDVLQREGLRPFFLRTSLRVGNPMWNTLTSRYPIGTNIFDRDWEILIILDSCRVDALQSLADSIPWLNDIGQILSVGSMSAEWALNTFTYDYLSDISKTALISRNVWSQRILNEQLHTQKTHDYSDISRGFPDWNPVTVDTFKHYERVEPIANQDNRLHPDSTSIPHIVTDRAITIKREMDPDHLIIWYRMPHLNFIGDALKWTAGETSLEELMTGPDVVRECKPEEKSYDLAKRGRISRKTMYDSYLQNLRLVLEYVGILLQNVNSNNVVISADHGEALGENGLWGHSYGYPFSPVKTVPWSVTTATDEETYDPQYDELERYLLPEERKEQLQNMGYL